jgi:transcriptional regulator with XRE-family HTH domain
MKTPNLIDKHVGSRLRMRRIMLGMSQEKLAVGFGLTFQQVQKYEKGVNRMGASRLQQAAQILDVTVRRRVDTSWTKALRRQPMSTSLSPAQRD